MIDPLQQFHDLATISDKILLERCEDFGKRALFWRNKFRALLPEVERRKLYLRKGFSNIYEFGERLAGLSEAQIAESLNIAPRLADKPELKKLLESGNVSVNKIARIISIATPENEEELAEKVQLLSKGALEVFARDVKCAARSDFMQAANPSVGLPGQKVESGNIFLQELGLSDDNVERLKELRQRGIDVNAELSEFLDQRESQIKTEKLQIAESLVHTESSPARAESLAPGRYIPVRIKNLIKKEFGNKCAKEGCTKKAKNIHHTARYGLTYSHDPHFLAPLCIEHHAIAHTIDVKATDRRWRGRT